MGNSMLMVVVTTRGTLVGEVDRDPDGGKGDVYHLRRCLSLDSFPGNPALALFAYPVPAPMLPDDMEFITRIPKVTVAAYTTFDLANASSELVSMYKHYWEDEEDEAIPEFASDTQEGSQPPVQ